MRHVLGGKDPHRRFQGETEGKKISDLATCGLREGFKDAFADFFQGFEDTDALAGNSLEIGVDAL